jgi:hypothetical protein
MSEVSQHSTGETEQQERTHQAWMPLENVIWLRPGFSVR